MSNLQRPCPCERKLCNRIRYLTPQLRHLYLHTRHRTFDTLADCYGACFQETFCVMGSAHCLITW